MTLPVKPLNSLAETLKHNLNEDELTNCMRCGFCLPACPTYEVTGLEAESPRGRIALMKAVTEGLMEPDEAFEEQMNHCLGCRACEPACPADVQYGELIEQAWASIEQHKQHSLPAKLTRKVLLDNLIPRRKRMNQLGKLMKFYQKSGLQRLTRGLGVMKLFPEPLRDMERILPEINDVGVVNQLGTFLPAEGNKIGTVALFRGCIMDTVFAETNEKTARLLSAAGYDVVIPDDQGCCGALYAHSGELERASELAIHNLQVFKDGEIDYIVSNAGGCGALLVEYDRLLQEDPTWAKDGAKFAAKVQDIADLLIAGNPIEYEESDENIKVTYQDSCHLRNVMKGGQAARQLIQQVANVEYVELEGADRCCGSAGTYNLLQPELAGQILEGKMTHVNDTQAQHLLTSNPGCLLQMKSGIEKHGAQSLGMSAHHLVDFLYERKKNATHEDG